MGMFDTIRFESPIACAVCQAPISATQTKAFECLMDDFHIGDCIGHAEELRLVREGLYCDACHAIDQQFVYLAVYRGILVDITSIGQQNFVCTESACSSNSINSVACRSAN